MQYLFIGLAVLAIETYRLWNPQSAMFTTPVAFRIVIPAALALAVLRVDRRERPAVFLTALTLAIVLNRATFSSGRASFVASAIAACVLVWMGWRLRSAGERPIAHLWYATAAVAIGFLVVWGVDFLLATSG